MPSTSAPAATARSAAERDPKWAARKRSRRSPAASTGTFIAGSTRRDVERAPWRRLLAVGRDERAKQDGNADDDEAVGEVERGPPLQVDEVRDVVQPDAV